MQVPAEASPRNVFRPRRVEEQRLFDLQQLGSFRGISIVGVSAGWKVLTTNDDVVAGNVPRHDVALGRAYAIGTRRRSRPLSRRHALFLFASATKLPATERTTIPRTRFRTMLGGVGSRVGSSVRLNDP